MIFTVKLWYYVSIDWVNENLINYRIITEILERAVFQIFWI